MWKNKLFLYIGSLLLVIACRKSQDLSAYEVESQAMNLTNGGSALTIDKGSLPANATFVYRLPSVSFSGGFKTDHSGHAYVGHSNGSFLLQSSGPALAKPAHFRLAYYLCTNSSLPCQINHSELLPYKIRTTSDYLIYNDNVELDIAPVTNFSIDSVARIISFDETELNCVYVIGRKF